jgi:hypothetical protein
VQICRKPPNIWRNYNIQIYTLTMSIFSMVRACRGVEPAGSVNRATEGGTLGFSLVCEDVLVGELF